MISIAVSIFESHFAFQYLLVAVRHIRSISAKLNLFNLGDNNWIFCGHWIPSRGFRVTLQVVAAFSLFYSVCLCSI